MRKRKSRFFENLKESNGAQWLMYVSPDELNKNALYFFKDLAFNAIDKSLWGEAFYDEQFMRIMINKAYSEYSQSAILKAGLDSLALTQPGISNDAQYQIAYTHIMKRTSGLEIVYQGLNNIYNDKNLGWLDYISINAKQYRYDI